MPDEEGYKRRGQGAFRDVSAGFSQNSAGFQLAQEADQSMATVLAGTRTGERTGARLGQAQRVVQLNPAPEVIARLRKIDY
jgi:hypothetical protein